MKLAGSKYMRIMEIRNLLTHYRQLNTEIYEIYTGLSETVYYTQRLFP